MRKQLERLAAGQDIKSSDLEGDRARTRLKKLRMIEFDRTTWMWVITDAGSAALKTDQNGR